MRGALSPLSGVICEIVNSVQIWSEKFYICQENIREFQKPLAVVTMLISCLISEYQSLSKATA